MPAVAERLPWTLRAYRGFASMATPLARPRAGEALAARQGAPGAARRAARRKQARAPARAADLGAWRERRRDARRHPAGRGLARAQFQCAGDVRHRDVGAACRAAAAAGRDPSIHPARRAALHRALPRALAAEPRAARRVRPVAEPDHRLRGTQRSADPGERPPVGALVHALALSAVDHRRAAVALRPVPHAIGHRRRALFRARRAARHHDRQSQARRAGARRSMPASSRRCARWCASAR